MLTIFSTPKPFRGHIGIIQCNALRSWKLLHPEIEIILFGDEQGAAETARELGIRHEPAVARHPSGMKFLDSLFYRAQEIARHPLVCYANCDIILMEEFTNAVREVTRWNQRFLLVGRRWDVEISEPWNFDTADWCSRLKDLAVRKDRQQPAQWIDYFVFPRGLYQDIPAFLIGRVAWDNWLLWRARALGAPVVDASKLVTAVHQNHDYAYHPQGATGVWQDDLAQRNIELAGGWRHLHTIEDANYALAADGLHPRFRHHLLPAWRLVRRAQHGALSALLRTTRPLRHAVGLREENLTRLAQWVGLPKSRSDREAMR